MGATVQPYTPTELWACVCATDSSIVAGDVPQAFKPSIDRETMRAWENYDQF